MPAKNPRRKFVFKKGTSEKLDWLVDQQNKNSKKKVYPYEVVEELIENAYIIQKAFGKT